MNKKIFGNFGENKAVEFLKNINYEILERNFLCRQGEVDIIAKDIEKNEIVFIEVKTRNNELYGKAVDAVNEYKQKHIWKATEYYLYKNNLLNSFIRFDVIEVYIRHSQIYINHIKNMIEREQLE